MTGKLSVVTRYHESGHAVVAHALGVRGSDFVGGRWTIPASAIHDAHSSLGYWTMAAVRLAGGVAEAIRNQGNPPSPESSADHGRAIYLLALSRGVEPLRCTSGPEYDALAPDLARAHRLAYQIVNASWGRLEKLARLLLEREGNIDAESLTAVLDGQDVAFAALAEPLPEALLQGASDPEGSVLRPHPTEPDTWVIFCPGCGHDHTIRAQASGQLRGDQLWMWNKSQTKPTFWPSLLVELADGKICHSWIRLGVMYYIADTTAHGWRCGLQIPPEGVSNAGPPIAELPSALPKAGGRWMSGE